MLQDLRAKRKIEDKRHSRLVKQAKKLNPKDLLEIAAVTGITAAQLHEMASRMGKAPEAPADVPQPGADNVADQVAADPPEQAIVVADIGEFQMVLAELPDA